MARFKEFGTVIEEGSKGFKEFGEVIDLEESPSASQGVAKQAAIGLAEGGLGTVGDILSLVGLNPRQVTPGEAAITEAQRTADPSLLPFLTDDDIAPRFSGISSGEDVKGLLELLGVNTSPQGVSGRFARRIGGNVGAGALFGGGLATLLGLGGAGAVGQGVEEVAGPKAGAIAEITSLLAPAALAKGIRPPKKLTKAAESGKRLGLSEGEIAPLLRSEKATRALGKVASKGRRSQKVLGEINEGFGRSFEKIKEQATKSGRFTPQERKGLTDGVKKIKKRLGKSLKGTDKEKVIDSLSDLEEKLRSGSVTGGDIIDYWQEVNSSINWKAVKGGKKRLAEVKDIFRDSLGGASPQILEDFEGLNTLYGRFKNLEKSLKPGKVDDYLLIAEGAPVFFKLASLDIPGAAKAVGAAGGVHAARKATTAFMLSPRTQGMFKKVFSLSNKGKIQQAQTLARRIESDYKKSVRDPSDEH